jgi:hypothetical protein
VTYPFSKEWLCPCLRERRQDSSLMRLALEIPHDVA